MLKTRLANPFRPGAGHMPPYLAGRVKERDGFQKLLEQDVILDNLVLTGLRGVGKTVLLETLKPIAIESGWVWCGSDLSETVSVSEMAVSQRIMTDLSSVTSTMVSTTRTIEQMGFNHTLKEVSHPFGYDEIIQLWNQTPGLTSDRLKHIIETVWRHLEPLGKRGLIFAYDEAQNLGDHAEKEEYPLALLLDVFQSLQRKNLPVMLVLTGLPNLFPNLVEARTFAERMFNVTILDRLDYQDRIDAIKKPIENTGSAVKFTEETVHTIAKLTAGYPYFIQYICREVFDAWMLSAEAGEDELPSIPAMSILRKLDDDFFAGRWAKATDRQRDLLMVVAQLETSSAEFTVQEIVEKSKEVSGKSFAGSHVNQMLLSLTSRGLIYKNRWGKYSLAVPLLDQFILRQAEQNQTVDQIPG